MATLISVNTGKPKDVSWQGRTVYTGAWKQPVDGPLMVRRTNIDGDGQGDLAGHGGENRAVLVYQAASYTYWRGELGRDDLEFGMFGENFTVDGLPDDEVCVGDRYRIGGAEFEVTQPRVTCYRVGMRMGEPAMASLLVAHHRPGFYLRVVTEGRVRAGDGIERTRVGPGEVTVAEADALLYLPGGDRRRLRVAAGIPALSPGWRQSYREMLDAAPAAGAGEADGWTGFRRLRVTGASPETPDIRSIRLAADDGADLPPAAPGQYLTVRIPGADGPGAVRSYSLSSAPGAAEYRISVKHEPRGLVSGYLHTRLRPGDVLEAARPRGEFVLRPGSAPVLLISAGVGATPLLSMLGRLAAQRFPEPVWWIHSARDISSHAFADEVRELMAELPRAREHVVYTRPQDGSAPRRLTRDLLASWDVPADCDTYLCGPQAFMDGMREALRGLGVPDGSVRTELFGSLAPVTPGVVGASATTPHQPPGPPGDGPRVTFARSGITTPWSDAHASLLELAEACDVPSRWSCRTGVCHTCLTGLVTGSVTYGPEPLDPPARDSVLVCCARPDEDVVVDL